MHSAVIAGDTLSMETSTSMNDNTLHHNTLAKSPLSNTRRIFKMSGYIAVLTLITTLVFATVCSCEKPKEQNSPQNISLYDKDTITICNYIKGQWKVVYATGGLLGSTEYCDDYFVEFTANNEFILSRAEFTQPDTSKFIWVKEKNIHFLTPDSVFIMQLIDKGAFFINKIDNDTLVYDDYAYDGMSYHCVKATN